MRIVKYLSILSAFFLFSCSGESPESVVKEFYSAVKEKNFDKAKTLATKGSQSTIDMLDSGMDISLGEGELKNVDCVTENEESNCDCFFEGNSKPVAVTLLKEDGSWKLDIQATAKNMINNVFDKFKDVDLNGLMDKLGGDIEINTDKINEVIKNIDADKLIENLKGMDSSFSETGESLENLINEVQEGLEKSKKDN